MLDRTLLRAAFWALLTALSVVSALLSFGGDAVSLLGSFASLLLDPSLLPEGLSLEAVGLAAPFLSAGALALAAAGWLLVRSDLTGRSIAQAERQGLADRLHEAMQASADAVFMLRSVHDRSGQLVDFVIAEVNPSGARLVRSTRAELIGVHLRRDPRGLLDDSAFARYAAAVDAGEALHVEQRLDRRRFEAAWVQHQAVPVAGGLAVTLRDISAPTREARRLRRASITDELTSLHNRRGFLSHAEQALRLARRQAKDAVLLYVDMDGFKGLNDRHGHAEGDRALAAVARLLRRAVRDCDVVARMGGDEFTILAIDADAASARSMQRRIEASVERLNASGELAAPVALTIGYARVRPLDDAPLPELMARADALLYSRKRRRKAAALAREQAIARGDRPATLAGEPSERGEPAPRGRTRQGAPFRRLRLTDDAMSADVPA